MNVKAFAAAHEKSRSMVAKWLTKGGLGEDSILEVARITGATPWWIRYGVGEPFAAVDEEQGRYTEADRIAFAVIGLPMMDDEDRAVEALRRVFRRRLPRGVAQEVFDWAVDELLELPTESGSRDSEPDTERD